LTINQGDLADLPLGLVVGGALVVLAAEERPVCDVAGAGLVAAKMIGDDLARELLGVLTGDTASVLVVEADELALRVRDVLSGVVESGVKVGILVKLVLSKSVTVHSGV
jgi:hypothetical protein